MFHISLILNRPWTRRVQAVRDGGLRLIPDQKPRRSIRPEGKPLGRGLGVGRSDSLSVGVMTF